MIPMPATVEQLRDFCQWHVEAGLGSHAVMVDKRGMDHLVLPRHVGMDIGLALPLEGESGNPDLHQIFLRAAF